MTEIRDYLAENWLLDREGSLHMIPSVTVATHDQVIHVILYLLWLALIDSKMTSMSFSATSHSF